MSKQYMSSPGLDRELKKGSAELLILSLVEDQPRHGYDIGQLIELRSRGALRFNVASLYPLLYRLEKRGWIRGRWIDYNTGKRTIRAMPTFHPAYLLRSPLYKRLAWQDLRAIAKLLAGA